MFFQGIVQLTEIQPSQPFLPLERRPARPRTGKPVCLERKMKRENSACRALHRREAHHIHSGYGSGKLISGKSLFPRRPGYFRVGSALELCTGASQEPGWRVWTGGRRDKTMAHTENSAAAQTRQKHIARQVPVGCAACSNRRPGWFCSLGSAVLADLELVTSTVSLPAQASLFTQGDDARCLYLICGGYLKLTAGRHEDRQMIVRVAGPGSMLGLYAVLSHGLYEVSAESLTSAQLRPVERDRFLSFLRSHKEAQMRAVQCICQEYRFALQDACRIALTETVAARLGRLLLELANQIGEHLDGDLIG